MAWIRALAKVCRSDRADEAVEAVRRGFAAKVMSSRGADRQALLASGFVVTDLVTQGWTVRLRNGHGQIRPPDSVADPLAERPASGGRNWSSAMPS